MNVKIRALAHADRVQWDAMFEAYGAFYKTQVPTETRENVWEWIFDPDNDFWCDVAIGKSGEIIGFTQYQLMHRSLGGAMVCYLSDLYVDPEIRGTGTGRALIDHVLRFARSRGINNVRWLTQEFNYSARKLYDSYQPKSDFILYSVPVE